MPLDPTIPLRAVAPAYQPGQGMETLKTALAIKAAGTEDQLNQLKITQAKNDMMIKLLSGATDQASYDTAKQQAAANGIDTSRAPEQFDPQHINQLMMASLDAKDRLDNQYRDATLAETMRHNKADEGSFGSGVDGKAYNILLNGDASTPQYAMAYNIATQPKLQMVTNPDGSTQMAAITPSLPDSIRKPGAVAPNPIANPTAAAGTPPALPAGITPPASMAVGANPVNPAMDVSGVAPPPANAKAAALDTMLTTPTSSLLPPPGTAAAGAAPASSAPPKSFSVTPIGQPSTPKFTEDQSKSGGYATRMESAVGDLDRITTEGYKPNWETNVGNKLNDMTNTSTFLSSQGQQYDQAARNFINANLRRESGATITPAEFANAYKQYLPQAGDQPEVLAQKARNRADALQAMKVSAGPAYRPSAASAAAPTAHPPGWSDAQEKRMQELQAKANGGAK